MLNAALLVVAGINLPETDFILLKNFGGLGAGGVSSALGCRPRGCCSFRLVGGAASVFSTSDVTSYSMTRSVESGSMTQDLSPQGRRAYKNK
jgi:hypothetical protein